MANVTTVSNAIEIVQNTTPAIYQVGMLLTSGLAISLSQCPIFDTIDPGQNIYYSRSSGELGTFSKNKCEFFERNVLPFDYRSVRNSTNTNLPRIISKNVPKKNFTVIRQKGREPLEKSKEFSEPDLIIKETDTSLNSLQPLHNIQSGLAFKRLYNNIQKVQDDDGDSAWETVEDAVIQDRILTSITEANENCKSLTQIIPNSSFSVIGGEEYGVWVYFTLPRFLPTNLKLDDEMMESEGITIVDEGNTRAKVLVFTKDNMSNAIEKIGAWYQNKSELSIDKIDSNLQEQIDSNIKSFQKEIYTEPIESSDLLVNDEDRVRIMIDMRQNRHREVRERQEHRRNVLRDQRSAVSEAQGKPVSYGKGPYKRSPTKTKVAPTTTKDNIPGAVPGPAPVLTGEQPSTVESSPRNTNVSSEQQPLQITPLVHWKTHIGPPKIILPGQKQIETTEQISPPQTTQLSPVQSQITPQTIIPTQISLQSTPPEKSQISYHHTDSGPTTEPTETLVLHNKPPVFVLSDAFAKIIGPDSHPERQLYSNIAKIQNGVSKAFVDGLRQINVVEYINSFTMPLPMSSDEMRLNTIKFADNVQDVIYTFSKIFTTGLENSVNLIPYLPMLFGIYLAHKTGEVVLMGYNGVARWVNGGIVFVDQGLRVIGNGANYARQGITDGVNNARQGITDGVRYTRQGIAHGVNNVRQEITNGVENVRQSITNGVNSVSNAGIQTVKSVKKFSPYLLPIAGLIIGLQFSSLTGLELMAPTWDSNYTDIINAGQINQSQINQLSQTNLYSIDTGLLVGEERFPTSVQNLLDYYDKVNAVNAVNGVSVNAVNAVKAETPMQYQNQSNVSSQGPNGTYSLQVTNGFVDQSPNVTQTVQGPNGTYSLGVTNGVYPTQGTEYQEPMQDLTETVEPMKDLVDHKFENSNVTFNNSVPYNETINNTINGMGNRGEKLREKIMNRTHPEVNPQTERTNTMVIPSSILCLIGMGFLVFKVKSKFNNKYLCVNAKEADVVVTELTAGSGYNLVVSPVSQEYSTDAENLHTFYSEYTTTGGWNTQTPSVTVNATFYGDEVVETARVEPLQIDSVPQVLSNEMVVNNTNAVDRSSLVKIGDTSGQISTEVNGTEGSNSVVALTASQITPISTQNALQITTQQQQLQPQQQQQQQQHLQPQQLQQLQPQPQQQQLQPQQQQQQHLQPQLQQQLQPQPQQPQIDPEIPNFTQKRVKVPENNKNGKYVSAMILTRVNGNVDSSYTTLFSEPTTRKKE